MFVFRKIWRALLCYLSFEIRPFALLPTTYTETMVKGRVVLTFREWLTNERQLNPFSQPGPLSEILTIANL